MSQKIHRQGSFLAEKKPVGVGWWESSNVYWYVHDGTFFRTMRDLPETVMNSGEMGIFHQSARKRRAYLVVVKS